jgi:hypothetical protein
MPSEIPEWALRMAKGYVMPLPGCGTSIYLGVPDFARALVRAFEHGRDSIADTINDIILAERTACAEIARNAPHRHDKGDVIAEEIMRRKRP